MPSPLTELRKIRASYGEGNAGRKVSLLRTLERARLPTARQITELHEVLCFLRAYPDDAEVLASAERMLESFARRSDLARHRAALTDSGIDGTPIRYRFFWPMARWLAERWPDQLHLDLGDGEAGDRLKSVLPQLVTQAEAAAIKRSEESAPSLLQRIVPAGRTDAAFLIDRIGASPGDDFTREALHDGIDAEYRFDPGADSPSRTRAHHRTGPTVFQTAPPSRERPDLAAELRRKPLEIREVSLREGRALIDRACEAMVTRSRDLEVFLYGDPRDVRLVIDRDGLAFACIGVLPERRVSLRAGYGWLTLKNGVPIGYVQSDALFESAEIAFNTFETYRGADAAWVFGRMLAAANHLFGAASFSVEPYQLGLDNDEALESGAWWFYYKLGFRPAARAPQKFVAEERRRMKRDPSYRSNRKTLEKLSRYHLYFDLDPAGQPIESDLARIGWRVAEHAERFEDCASNAAERLGLSSWGTCTPGQRIAVERWSPILLTLPLERWSARERRLAAEVVKAKGGRRESDFVRRFDTHPRLREAIAELVLPGASTSRVIH